MRELTIKSVIEEINNDIKNVEKQIYDLKSTMSKFKQELRNRLFFDFCERFGRKDGDIVETKAQGLVLPIGIDPFINEMVQVKKIKKDGTPYSYAKSIHKSAFYDCKIFRVLTEEEDKVEGIECQDGLE